MIDDIDTKNLDDKNLPVRFDENAENLPDEVVEKLRRQIIDVMRPGYPLTDADAQQQGFATLADLPRQTKRAVVEHCLDAELITRSPDFILTLARALAVAALKVA
jgi:hypothetical protein